MSTLLSVKDLRVTFDRSDEIAPAVDGVSFDLNDGEMLGIVGESGSGKSVTALSILQLIPTPPGRVLSGEILLDGADLLQLGDDDIRRIRGNSVAMIFQEPMTSLNPVFTVGSQIMEPLIQHQNLTRKQARRRVIELLGLVGIPSPAQRVREYPHQLSGGMRQRVMISMALACGPKILIADEPTTALDVTIQAQILDLIHRLQDELKMATILITHNLGVVAGYVDRVIVMYAGKVVEQGSVEDVFEKPLHPYTEGLRSSIPRLDADIDRLITIDGVAPSPFDMPVGCSFGPRCQHFRRACSDVAPDLIEIERDHHVACIRHSDYQHVTAGREKHVS